MHADGKLPERRVDGKRKKAEGRGGFIRQIEISKFQESDANLINRKSTLLETSVLLRMVPFGVLGM